MPNDQTEISMVESRKRVLIHSRDLTKGNGQDAAGLDADIHTDALITC